MTETITPLGGKPLAASLPPTGDKSQILPLDRRGAAYGKMMIFLGVDPQVMILWDRISKEVARYMIPLETFEEMIKVSGCHSVAALEKLAALVYDYRPPVGGLYSETRNRYKDLFSSQIPRTVLDSAVGLRLAYQAGYEPARHGMNAARKTGKFAHVFDTVVRMSYDDWYSMWFMCGMPVPDGFEMNKPQPLPLPKKKHDRSDDETKESIRHE